MSNVDFSGDASSNISKVGVIVSNLDGVDPALHGFMGAIDWAGYIFARNVHRPARLQSWLSHFALVIDFDQCSDARDLWLLERGEGGVTFRPIHEGEFHNEFRWRQGHRCDGHFPNGTASGSSKVLCNIHSSENNAVITRESVWEFVRHQMQFEYNIVHKNCKHFAYDFYYYCLHSHWVRNIHFPMFTEAIEAEWVEHRGW